MSILANKDLVHRFFDQVYNEGRVGAIDEMFAPDFVDHSPFPGQSPDLAGWRHTVMALRAALPDAYVSLEDLIAEGDEVASREVLAGTQRGEIMGVPPSDEEVRVTATDVFRIANGRIVEHWGNRDDLGLLEQIGALPEIVVVA